MYIVFEENLKELIMNWCKCKLAMLEIKIYEIHVNWIKHSRGGPTFGKLYQYICMFLSLTSSLKSILRN